MPRIVPAFAIAALIFFAFGAAVDVVATDEDQSLMAAIPFTFGFICLAVDLALIVGAFLWRE